MLKNNLLLLTVLFSATITYSTGHAAEVKNLKVGQSGDKVFATYDLAGKIGEREAEITVKLSVNGESYSSDKITLTGDFGKKVKTGVGRRIVWDILSDIPTGFDGEVVWDVNAISGPATTTVGNTTVQLPVPAIPATNLPKPDIKSLADTGIGSRFKVAELVISDRETGLLWLREVSKNGDGVNLGKARSAATKLKEQKLAGCIEWRLPWEDELKLLVEYAQKSGYTGRKSKGYPSDYFNSIGFKGVSNDFYWSDSGNRAFGYSHLQRMAVDLEDGLSTAKNVDKEYLQYWPVCKPD